VARCAAAGIRIGAVAPGILRAVTHLDIDDAGLERAIGVLGPLLRRP
jgi:threonine aldolase